MAELKQGETALMHAAGSGVGMAGIQSANALGGCPRISVHGSLTPGLAWCSRAQMGRGP
jgi:NADPH:quinone reductase-like Zn-dependent oxidoreductase